MVGSDVALSVCPMSLLINDVVLSLHCRGSEESTGGFNKHISFWTLCKHNTMRDYYNY